MCLAKYFHAIGLQKGAAVRDRLAACIHVLSGEGGCWCQMLDVRHQDGWPVTLPLLCCVTCKMVMRCSGWVWLLVTGIGVSNPSP